MFPALMSAAVLGSGSGVSFRASAWRARRVVPRCSLLAWLRGCHSRGAGDAQTRHQRPTRLPRQRDQLSPSPPVFDQPPPAPQSVIAGTCNQSRSGPHTRRRRLPTPDKRSHCPHHPGAGQEDGPRAILRKIPAVAQNHLGLAGSQLAIASMQNLGKPCGAPASTNEQHSRWQDHPIRRASRSSAPAGDPRGSSARGRGTCW